jgi:hypothetical protein
LSPVPAAACSAPGETACVLLQVENNSSAAFSIIKLKLHRRIKLSAGSGFQELKSDLAEQSFPGMCMCG